VPLYEYQCKKCKHKFEKIQKFSDRAIKKCPECGGPLEKIQHAPNVQFKGSGWYVTDYGGKKGGSDSDGGSEKKDDSSTKLKETSQGDKEAKEGKDGRDREKEGRKDKDKDRDKDRPKEKDKDSKPKKSETKKAKD
jgi:putative FmdB family regulatory protein